MFKQFFIYEGTKNKNASKGFFSDASLKSLCTLIFILFSEVVKSPSSSTASEFCRKLHIANRWFYDTSFER